MLQICSNKEIFVFRMGGETSYCKDVEVYDNLKNTARDQSSDIRMHWFC